MSAARRDAVRLRGTHALEEDIQRQRRMSRKGQLQLVRGGDYIRGELVEIGPTSELQMLTRLDALEGFAPRTTFSLYRQVLVQARVGSNAELAWVYVVGPNAVTACYIRGGNWPPMGQPIYGEKYDGQEI